jgi:hypothetical protein
MTARSTTNNKLDKLYAELSEIERARMQAKLSKAHDTAGMDRLRRATPPEHAEAYNRALGLLRVLNGHMLDWIAIFHIGMERDRMRLQHATSVVAQRWLTRATMFNTWRIVPYPVTDSEYRTLVNLERSQPYSVRDYADLIWDRDGLRPELQAIVQEYRDADEPSDAEQQEAFWKGYENRIAAMVRAAIKRGELPKPKPAPKDANNADPGDIWLPTGALKDWADGTTEATYKPLPPSFAVPIIGALDDGMRTEWDIRPDGEVERVKAQREAIRDVFLDFLRVTILRDERASFPSFEPPLTRGERDRACKLADEIKERLEDLADEPAGLALEAAQTHATHRAQLEDLLEAIEIIRRDDFGGEDPLWEEVRTLIARVQAEAERFDENWADALGDVYMRRSLRKAQGLEGWPMDETGRPIIDAPVPLPEGEHDLEGTLSLIRDWSR